jgi:hypothetical protein
MYYIFVSFRWSSCQRRGDKSSDRFKEYKVLIHWKTVPGVSLGAIGTVAVGV